MPGIARFPIKNRKVETRKSVVKGVLTFGPDNLLPQTLIDMVSNSVTASSCQLIRARFIEGNGLFNKALSETKVYRNGLTIDELIRQTSQQIAAFEVISLLVNYNGLGQIVGIKPVPVELIRLYERDGFGNLTHAGIFPHIGSYLNANRRKEHTKINLFNPDPLAVMQQIEQAGSVESYPGQLIYEPFSMPGDEEYHLPTYAAAFRDIETENELSEYDYRTVTNGFSVSGVLKYLGRVREGRKVEDEYGNFVEIPYDSALDPNSIEYQMANNQGARNAGAILTYGAASKEELDSMNFVDTTGANLSQRYESTKSRVEGNIARSMQVPNELVNIRRVGGIAPTGDEIKVASQLMQSVVNPYQRKLTRLLSVIAEHWKTGTFQPGADFTIENLNYFSDNANATNAV